MMMPSSSFPPLLPLIILILLPAIGNASPINRQVGISDNVFMTTQNGTDGLEQRVCSIDAVTYRDGETIPTSSPCEHCVCRPPGFACTITSCEYRPGCKAFRRSDQCCPEYQCECEKDGKIYQNGDKIVDNNNPCEVCYCQGGEIICAVIDCYWRNDCPPRYIDNRCCPMYDHCPPPAAQGPIRHRLPPTTLTSPVPISWHNLTMGVSTKTTTTSTSSPSTSASTTTSEAPSTTTTAAPSTSSEAPVIQDAPVTTEPPQELPAADDATNNLEGDVSSSSSTTSDVTTAQPELEASVQDNIVNDEHLHQQPDQTTYHDELPSATEALDLSATQVPSLLEAANPSILTTGRPSSEEGSTIVSEPTAAVILASADPTTFNDDASSPAPTTSQPIDFSLPGDDNDLGFEVATSAYLLQEIVHDEAVTEQKQSDATETAPVETHDEENILADSTSTGSGTESPSEPVAEPEPLGDDVEQPISATENTILSDPVEVTTQAAGVNLVRHDISSSEANTQPPFADFTNEEEETTSAPSQASGSEVEFVFDDVAAAVEPEAGTTAPQILHDEAPSATVPSVEDSPQEILSDSPETTVASDLLQNDEPSATQPPSVSNDENSEATEQPLFDDDASSPTVASISQDATERNEILSDEPVTSQPPQIFVREESAATESLAQQDDLVTEASQSLDDDQQAVTQVSQDSQNDDNATERIVSDDATERIASDDATERIVSDDTTERIASDDATERIVSDDATERIVSDDAQVTESSQDDEPTATENPQSDATERIQNDEAQVTEGSNSGVNDDDAILADEPAQTQQPIRDAQDDSENVTEKIAADAAVTEAEQILDDEVPSGVTEVPSSASPSTSTQSSDNKIVVFDIILNDETDPETPETLNQVRESILSDSEVSNLLEGVRNADAAERERISIGGVGGALSDEETTIAPVIRDDGKNTPANDDPATTQVNNVEVLNDQEETSTALSDLPVQTETPSGVLNDEQQETQTQREFRDDIDDLLRHHINGEPHGDEENVATTALPPPQGRGEEIDVTTEVPVNDEPGTTVEPEAALSYRNKVQKVSEVLAQQNLIPGSEESLTKFRLEPDIFGGSLEVVQDEEPEVTTVPAEKVRSEGVEVTTVEAERIQDEVAPTEQTPELTARDDLEVSTQRDDVSVTESNGLIQNDEVEVTTRLSDDVQEGSGSSHDGVEETEAPALLQDEVTEGSGAGLARFDLEGVETTVAPLKDDVEDGGVTTSAPISSYAFRMDILNSLEEEIEHDGGSGNGEIQKDVEVTSAPQYDPVAVTEQQAIADEAPVPTTEASQNDEPALEVTTESTVSRFRTDLEIETEAPSQSSSVSPSEQQNDFVEVSTGAPSGFAVEFKENADEIASTQAPEEIHNDEPVVNQAPDIIPDDEPATPATIPISNLVLSDDATERSNDEPIAQTSGPQVTEEAIANDEAVTEAIVHDEPATEPAPTNDEPEVTSAPEPISNDEPAATSEPEAISNDDVTDRNSNDEPAVTQTVNDAETPTETAPLQDPAENEALATSSSLPLNDESATIPPASAPNDQEDSIIFSDDPAPSTSQPLDRLRSELLTDSIEQSTDASSSPQNDDPTTEAIVSDDISVTTTIPQVNTSDTKAAKKDEQLILPKIQPISPDLLQRNSLDNHQFRFDFPMAPEKDNSWLSRAVAQFRRMAGFTTSDTPNTRPPMGSSSRIRVPSRRFLLF